MSGLLALLREHPGAVEADLQRYYGIDYDDRWRRDDHGRPKLSLRRIGVLIWRYPPVEGAVVVLAYGRVPWARTEHLLDELRRSVLAIGGVKKPKPHPDREQRLGAKSMTPERRDRLFDAWRRAWKRRQQIARGEIT